MTHFSVIYFGIYYFSIWVIHFLNIRVSIIKWKIILRNVQVPLIERRQKQATCFTLCTKILTLQKDLLFKGQNCPQINKQRIPSCQSSIVQWLVPQERDQEQNKKRYWPSFPSPIPTHPPSPRPVHAKQPPKITNK